VTRAHSLVKILSFLLLGSEAQKIEECGHVRNLLANRNISLMQSVRSEDSTPLVVTHVAYVAKKFSSTLTEVEMTLNNISVTILCWRITGLSAEN